MRPNSFSSSRGRSGLLVAHLLAVGRIEIPAVETRLCHESEVLESNSPGFDPEASGADTMFLVRSGEEVYAYLDACPHLGGTPMAWRRHAYLSGDKRFIVCHAHGARFDKASGLCLDGPCRGDSLTRVSVARYPNGDIYISSQTPETS